MTGKLAFRAASLSREARLCQRMPPPPDSHWAQVRPSPDGARRRLQLLAVLAGGLTVLQCDEADPVGGASITDEGGTSIDGNSAGSAGRAETGVGGRPAAEPQMHRDAASDSSTGGSSGDPADASADADDSADALQDHGGSVPDGPLGPPRCGDGWRDPATEECDDGVDTLTGDSCSNDCRVRHLIATPPQRSDGGPPRHARKLGDGRHPIGVGADGFALVYVDPYGATGAPEMGLTAFTGQGTPLGVHENLTRDLPIYTEPNPGVAALGVRKYALVWTDMGGDGDLLGVAMRTVDARSGALGAVAFANEARPSSQSAPDILRTPGGVVVAWMDEANPANRGDLRVRQFSTDLVPVGAREETLAATTAIERNVALASFRDSWAAAWVAVGNGEARIQTHAGAYEWSVGPAVVWSATDKPVLVEIDRDHLLLVFTEGTDPRGSGYPDVPRLRAAVLDTAAPGATASFEVLPRLAPYVNDRAIGQSHPDAARSADRLYVAWRAERAQPNAEEVWLKEIRLSVTGSALMLDLGADEIPLPRDASYQFDNQRRPAIAAAPLWPTGALVTSWEDFGRTLGASEGVPDVVVELIPTPVLRQPASPQPASVQPGELGR